MGDFIKELNVIDFLGILLPGTFLLLLLSCEIDVWVLLGSYWGEADAPNTAIRVTLLLVGGYMVGTLLHEAGDLLEKMLWKHYAFDPHVYAARSAGISTPETISHDPQLSSLSSGKNRGPCIFWVFIPLLLVLYGLFAQWASFSFIAAVLIFASLLITCGKGTLTEKHFPDLACLEQIRKSDAIFLAYPAEENYKTRKQMLFDGFRSMSRNLFIAIFILQLYAKHFSRGTLSALLLSIHGNQLYTAALFLVQALLLCRYWHFSYLKYKYCYEDYKNRSNQAKKIANI